jgi:hypothetical protein
MELPPYLAPTPLLYIEYFNVVRGRDDADGVGMYRVHRPPSDGGHTSNMVIPVMHVVHTLELVPVFHTRIPEVEVSSATCLDAYREYYVNSFADKEIHHIMSAYE